MNEKVDIKDFAGRNSLRLEAILKKFILKFPQES
jgi:hypothetical protein